MKSKKIDRHLGHKNDQGHWVQNDKTSELRKRYKKRLLMLSKMSFHFCSTKECVTSSVLVMFGDMFHKLQICLLCVNIWLNDVFRALILVSKVSCFTLCRINSTEIELLVVGLFGQLNWSALFWSILCNVSLVMLHLMLLWFHCVRIEYCVATD